METLTRAVCANYTIKSHEWTDDLLPSPRLKVFDVKLFQKAHFWIVVMSEYVKTSRSLSNWCQELLFWREIQFKQMEKWAEGTGI